jgi:hypothetical protein
VKELFCRKKDPNIIVGRTKLMSQLQELYCEEESGLVSVCDCGENEKVVAVSIAVIAETGGDDFKGQRQTMLLNVLTAAIVSGFFCLFVLSNGSHKLLS